MNFGGNIRVQGIGLAICVDLGNSGNGEKIKKKCQKEGLLLNTEDTNLQFFPALTIDKETATEGLDILERCL
jgi:acetylornithine/succinyldiaminopimelate/putrescine aminotransferase